MVPYDESAMITGEAKTHLDRITSMYGHVKRFGMSDLYDHLSANEYECLAAIMGLANICLDFEEETVIKFFNSASGKLAPCFDYLLYFFVNPPYIGNDPPEWVDAHNCDFSRPSLGPAQYQDVYYFILENGVVRLLRHLLEDAEARKKIFSTKSGYFELLIPKLNQVLETLSENKVWGYLKVMVQNILASLHCFNCKELYPLALCPDCENVFFCSDSCRKKSPFPHQIYCDNIDQKSPLVRLFVYASDGRVKELEEALSAFPENREKKYNGRNLLHFACENAQADVVELLLSKFSCDIEAKGNNNFTPLCYASACPRDDYNSQQHPMTKRERYNTIKVLLEHGANPNVEGEYVYFLNSYFL